MSNVTQAAQQVPQKCGPRTATATNHHSRAHVLYLKPLNLPDPVAAQLQQRECSEGRQALHSSDLVGGTEQLEQGGRGSWL